MCIRNMKESQTNRKFNNIVFFINEILNYSIFSVILSVVIIEISVPLLWIQNNETN